MEERCAARGESGRCSSEGLEGGRREADSVMTGASREEEKREKKWEENKGKKYLKVQIIYFLFNFMINYQTL